MGATPALLESLTGTVTRDASFANPEVWVSTHSANPGSSGANELTTGTGTSGRQQSTFNDGGSGSDPSNFEVSINVPSAETIPWMGLWTAQTGGTFLGGFPLVGPYQTAVGASGSALILCPAHGLSTNQKVRLFLIPNGQSAIPVGLAGDPSVYFVTVVDADRLLFAATLGGGAIVPSGSGAFFLATDETEVFTSSGGLLIFSIGNIIYETVS